MAQRQVGHNAGHGAALGAVLSHKLHAGGRVVKQIAHADGGALGTAGVAHLTGHAAVQMQHGAALAAPLAGENIHMGYGADGRQRLAAKAQRADGVQVVGGAQLAGGVAQKRRRELLRRNAAAVIADAKIGQTAALKFRHNGACAGVNGVFQQFLCHAGRAFHHLAGGDQVRHMGAELLDLRHGKDLLFR